MYKNKNKHTTVDITYIISSRQSKKLSKNSSSPIIAELVSAVARIIIFNMKIVNRF